MLNYVLHLLEQHWILVACTFLTAHLARNYFHNSLNKYPGPFLAKFTNLWRFFDVWGRRPDITHRKLHQKYGEVIRLGPNVLSFSNPRAIKTIYGRAKGFTKTPFYVVQQSFSEGVPLPTLFSTTDETFHAQLRRCVNHAFSMSSLVQYEGLVEETLSVFLDKTEELYADTRKVCDFALWLQYFAFDVIGQITYSKRHGFIEEVRDVDEIIRYLKMIFAYVAPIGQMPWMDNVFLKNPIILLLDRLGISLFQFPVAKFAKARIAERLLKLKNGENAAATQKPDLLSKFLKAQQDRPEIMTDRRVLSLAVSMTFAGSETTAISLSAVFYYLLKNPSCYAKLQAELDKAVQDGVVQDRPSKVVSWTEAQQLPYLDACVKEAFRMHPAAGLPLERFTPPEGIEIEGHMIPGGTIVGCNAWVVHKNEDIFGARVDDYIPERWINTDLEHVKQMEGSLFQFGAGSRTCIGKNISLLEIYKLIPSFMRRFDISFAGNDEVTYFNAWFVKQDNFMTRFRSRSGQNA